MSKRFGGVSGAKLSDKTDTLEVGDFLLEIKRCKWIEGRKKGEEFYLVEFTVLESDNERVRIGAARKWMPKMNEDYSDAKLKGFSLAASGIEGSDASAMSDVEKDLPDLLEASLDGPDPENVNIFKGRKVRCKVTRKTAKESGREYSDFRFSPGEPPPKTA